MGFFELASGIVKFILIGIVYIFILRVVRMVYLDISDTVIKTYEKMQGRRGGSIDELIAADREARAIAEKIISRI